MEPSFIDRLEVLGPQAFVKALFQLGNPQKALDHCNEALLHSYWKCHNLSDCRIIGEHAVQLAWEHAESMESSQPDVAAEVWGKIKPLCYNLASFTWPGWEEPGIILCDEDTAWGYACAEKNLWLAQKLKKNDLAVSRAYWLVGAHHLAANKLLLARESFQWAEEYAQRANAACDKLLVRAYLILLDIMLGEQYAIDEFEIALATLRQQEEGNDLAQQLETARRVFCTGPAKR